MAEYIELETFLKDIEERYCLPCKEVGRDHNGCKCDVCWVDDMCGDVIDAPDADVEPVVHGRWVEKMAPYGGRYFECSNCGAHENIHTAIKGYYCWRCGARMDGDDDG